MKKTLAELAAFFLILFACNSQSISKTELISFAKQFSVDGEVTPLPLRTSKSWGVWSRTPEKLKTKFHSDGTVNILYQADDDFSISLAAPFSTTPGTMYLLMADVNFKEGDAGVSFVVRNSENAVMDWASGYHAPSTFGDWQTVYATVMVAGGSEPNLVASYNNTMKNCTVGTLEPRFVGNKHTNGMIRNVELVKLTMKPLLTGVKKLSNEVLEVTVHENDASMTVHDIRTGKEYVQYPGNLHAAQIVACECSRNDTVTVTAFDLSDCRTLFITYTLHDDTVAVSLSDSVSQNNDPAKANALECLHTDVMKNAYNFPGPFAVSAKEYLVLPINEGISFYGDDMNMLTGDFYANFGHGICMPFFGATDGVSGWMCVLDTSDDGGVRLEHRAATSNNGELFTNGASPVWNAQCGSFGYTRRCRYIFLSEGGHVSIAKRYRAIAKENGTLVTFSEKEKQRGEDGARRIEALRGAVNVWTWWDRRVSLCKEMRDSGITRILWSAGDSSQNVAALNQIDGVLTGRYDIYQDVMDPKNFNKIQYVSSDWVTEAFPKDIARTADGNMVQAWPVETKNDSKKFINCVSLCDMTAPAYARKRLAEDLATHAYGARFFDTTTASVLRECYDVLHPMTHTQSKQARIELLGIISNEHHLVCGSETGADYAVPVCDYFEGMMSLGPYRVADSGRNCDQILTEVPEQIAKYQLGETYRLPLWELVYHDCTVAMWYWGDYNNKLPAVWDKRDLFNALYAVPPMFFTNENDFAKQRIRFLQSYNASKDITYATFDTEMTNHIFLSQDRSVQMTEFANGIKVIVNFSDVPFNFNGTTIAAKSILTVGIK